MHLITILDNRRRQYECSIGYFKDSTKFVTEFFPKEDEEIE